MDIRERIKAIISEKADLTVRSVSLAAGLSDSALHKFLTGATDSVTLKTVDKLADALGVDPMWLAYGEGTPEQASDISDMIGRIPQNRHQEVMAILEVFARTGTGG